MGNKSSKKKEAYKPQIDLSQLTLGAGAARDLKFSLSQLTEGVRVKIRVLCSSCNCQENLLQLPCRHLLCYKCVQFIAYESTENSLQGLERVECCRKLIPLELIDRAFYGGLTTAQFLTSSQELFECPIDQYPHLKDFSITLGCSHTFLKNNLRKYIEANITTRIANMSKIRCPNCPRILDTSEIIGIVTPKCMELYSKELLRTVTFEDEMIV